jgi:VanZ family protein
VRRFALWVAVALYLAAIFWLSSQPNPLPALTSRLSDKFLHCVEYGGLGLLLTLALAAGGVRARRAAAIALAAASLYGASDEVHQAYVPNRDADPRDWVADTAGAALGAALGATLLRRKAASASRPGPR